MAKVVVIGGTGFIGASAVDALLSQGHEVVVMARQLPHIKKQSIDANLSYIKGDLYQLNESQCLNIMKAVQRKSDAFDCNCSVELCFSFQSSKLYIFHSKVPSCIYGC